MRIPSRSARIHCLCLKQIDRINMRLSFSDLLSGCSFHPGKKLYFEHCRFVRIKIKNTYVCILHGRKNKGFHFGGYFKKVKNKILLVGINLLAQAAVNCTFRYLTATLILKVIEHAFLACSCENTVRLFSYRN